MLVFEYLQITLYSSLQVRHLTDRDMEAGEYAHLQSEIYRRPVYQFVRTKTEARSLSHSRKSTFINHVTENLEIPLSERAKRFHVSQFPMAVGRARTSVCRECSQFVGIFLSVRLSTRRGPLHGCSNCRLDPGHLFSTPCLPPLIFSSRNHSLPRDSISRTCSRLYIVRYM